MRKKAADALASFAITPEIRTVFLEALTSDKNPAVRLVAVDALAASAKQSPDAGDDRVAAREGGRPAGERLRPRQGGIGAEGHLLLRRERIETLMTTERLPLTMNTLKFDRRAAADVYESPTARADRLAVWILLALGLFLMLVSTGKGEQGTATRTDRFSGTLTAGQTLSVENISGDVVASPGSAFSAVVTVTVTAPSQKQADELLPRHAHRSEPGRGGLVARDALARNAREPRQERRLPALPRRRALRADGAAGSRRWLCRPSTATSRSATSTARSKLESVNGLIEAAGLRQSLEAQTVNGPIDASAQAVGRDSSLSLESVNGADHADPAEERAVRLFGRDDERHDRVDVSAAAPGIGG